MTTCKRASTGSETTTSAPETREQIGPQPSPTGSDETPETPEERQARMVRERDQRQREREERRASEIASAPWAQASFDQLAKGKYRPPRIICEGMEPSQAAVPPCLTEDQAAELKWLLEDAAKEIRPADPKAIAVILYRLAACVALPDKGDFEIAMECYVEDLEKMPEDILDRACVRWRRENKFWPTISELLAECRRLQPWEREGEDDYSLACQSYRQLALLDCIRREPAPDCVITSEWLDRMRYGAGLMLAGATAPRRHDEERAQTGYDSSLGLGEELRLKVVSSS